MHNNLRNNKKSADFYSLTPLISTWIRGLTDQKKGLDDAIMEHGSPLNIHEKQSFLHNMDEMSAAFTKYDLDHRIFFARKANKCMLFPQAAFEHGHGVDTASYRELKQCIDLGIKAEHIVCTAAVKTDRLIALAIQHGVSLAIDNWDECERIQHIAEELHRHVHIIVRLHGFVSDGKRLHTRFGFSIADVPGLIDNTFGKGNIFSQFVYKGLHFHLNGYSTQERADALWQCSELIEQLTGRGIKTESLDFGGGIVMNYLSSKEEWQEFDQAMQQAVRLEREELTIANDGLGYQLIDGKLHGQLAVYPYYNEVNKASFLEQILTTAKDGMPLYEKLRSLNIQLRIEPGRSLLDQCGITVARVSFRRLDTKGNLLIGLEMNRTQLRSSSADFLLDPIHIPTEKAIEEPTQGYLVGAYCLEQEFILKRKLRFTQLPQVGDLFAFVNTAGYMMHFYESEAHLFELAKNLVYNINDNTLILDKLEEF